MFTLVGWAGTIAATNVSEDMMTETETASDEATTPGSPGMLGAPRLRFEHLSMVFSDGTHALDDISFSVGAGEFVTVVGPSGCGKSTLLRIASGLTEHTAGDCDVDRDSIGYVFQDATLLPWRTVQKNVELNAELHGIPKDERKRRAAEAIELVNLVGHEDKYPKQLSGGMKMRCSLARSLVLNPEIFLFDEPFGALDEITRERLNDELINLFNSAKFAALFITHSIAEAVFLSTRVLVMSARPGRIIGDYAIPFGPERPHDLRFEADFAEICGQINDDLKDAHS
jgi:NitT/TauT family transport system ATP-binding protein